MGDRPFVCLARDKKTNEVRQVYRKKGGGFTRNEDNKQVKKLANPHRFSKKEADKCVSWGNKQKPELAVFATKQHHPFLVLDSDTKWGKDSLSDKLNTLGKRRKRYLWLGEYERSQKQQHDFYIAYLNGTGNLAALCNSGGLTGYHSWEECKKYPPSRSNHATGDASDTSYLHSGRSGSYTNVGNDSKCRDIMDDIDVCLPVGGEAWHVERGNSWNA